MAIPDLTRENLPYFTKRLHAIRPEDTPQFGSLTPPALMRHLHRGIEISVEEGDAPKDISIPVVRGIFRILFFEIFTKWPGGKIKVPDTLTPAPEGSLDEERDRLIAAMERFIDAAEAEPGRKTPNMAMGPITLKYYRHVHGVHFRHHFRQYNVLALEES
jgi:hypothetical protein